MGPQVLHLGPVPLPTHELFVLLGALVATAVYWAEARRRGMADQAHVAVAAGALLGGVLMAKGATAWRWALTTDEVTLWGLLAHGGKSILGGLFGAYAGAVLAKRLVGVRHSTGDLFAPAVAAGMAVGRIGCLLTEPVGTPTDLPWAVALSPAQADAVPGCTGACTQPSHPAHAYEVAFHLLTLVAVLRWRDRLPQQGMVFAAWLLAYGIFRFGNEMLRDNPEFWLGLSGSQVFLLLTIPLLAVGLVRRWRQPTWPPPSGPPVSAAGPTDRVPA